MLDSVRAFRERDADTPVVLMGYLNPIEIRGAERFAQEAVRGRRRRRAAGRPAAGGSRRVPRRLRRATACALILLASPTTGDARLRRLCDGAQGYLYYVSFAGVTGADRLDTARRGANACAPSRAQCAVPVVAGFGIKDAASAAAMAQRGRRRGGRQRAGRSAGGGRRCRRAAARAAAFLAPLRAALDASSAHRPAARWTPHCKLTRSAGTVRPRIARLNGNPHNA